MKKEETNDIVQYLIPALVSLGIPRENCKVNVTTDKSGRKRGDVWISTEHQHSRGFEKNIIALIEAKHRNSIVGDMDWRNAMQQGREKASKQGLNYYVVTNCISDFRFYNVHNDEEVSLDGRVLTKVVSLDILRKIQSQVSADNSLVRHRAPAVVTRISESRFRYTLKKLADIYRSAGLKKGDDRIDPTVGFVVLKYISEKEKEYRTLESAIKLWDDLRRLANGQERGDLGAEFKNMRYLIWDERSQYRDNLYKDFKDLIGEFSPKLKNEHFKRIYTELDGYDFHGADFDLFGAIYEEFASQSKKKEFGEFYTRRHIAGLVARLLLRNETHPRDLKICDPACGTGGFLTEAYKTLSRNYWRSERLNEEVERKLQLDVFWGYDNDDKSVARTKLNMFLVGDGHIHIYHVDDSLVGWDQSIGWAEQEFDYILTNPPMGKYEGEANLGSFAFTNEKRYELLFAEKVVKAVKPGGEIAIVINDGALEAPSRERFRKGLLEACNIYAVISLTKFTFAPYTKEKTYVLFMQKKQDTEMGEMQKFPIWHFIVDYDGYANSDKRYKTKYHDDLPVLEEKFDGAVKLAKIYLRDRNRFDKLRSEYESEVNEKEKGEGLQGMKYGYVEMERIGPANFYNLLSEFHLRPVVVETIEEEEHNRRIEQVTGEVVFLENALRDLQNLLKDDTHG